MILGETLESPVESKDMEPVNPKRNQPEYSLEVLILKLQYFGYLTWRAGSLEKTLMLGKIGVRKTMGLQRMRLLEGITNIMDMSLSTLWEMGWKESDMTHRLKNKNILFSVQFSCSVVSDSLRPHESQHARPPCPSPTPGIYSNCWWCHPAISYSVVPFSSCPQSLPASGSFPMSQLFAWGGQIIGVSVSTSVLPMNTQDWSPLGWTGWISLQSKGLSRVFSNTTVQKHQFFGTQLSSQSNSHIHKWPQEKP